MPAPDRFGLSRDPFGATADVDRYIPRPAAEAALAELETRVRVGTCPVLLVGPTGIGKTLLLRVLVERLRRELRFVELPYPALPAADLCAWALRALGAEPGAEPERELALKALRDAADGPPTGLVLDDAGSVPRDAAARFGLVAAAAEGALRVVLAASDAADPSVLDALAPVRDTVRFEESLTESETVHYVMACLARAHAPRTLRARFDPETLARLHRESKGLPARVNELATAVLLATTSTADRGTSVSAATARTAGSAPAPTSEAAADVTASRPWPLRRAGERVSTEPGAPSAATADSGAPAAESLAADAAPRLSSETLPPTRNSSGAPPQVNWRRIGWLVFLLAATATAWWLWTLP